MKTMKKWLMLLMVFHVVSASLAQDLCKEDCCPVELNPAGLMIGGIHNKGQFMASYKFMGMYMNGLQQGNTIIPAASVFDRYISSSDQMYMQMHMLMLMYGITSGITVMGMTGYNRLSMNMLMMPGSHGHGDQNKPDWVNNTAFTDSRILVLGSLLNKKVHEAEAGAGVSLPTGTISATGNENSMYPGQRLPYSMQTSSGTFDILSCFTYRYHGNRIIAGTQLSGVLRTGLNKLGYRQGNEVSLNEWFNFRFSRLLNTSLRAELIWSGKMSGMDTGLYKWMEPSADPFNYGGFRSSIFAGAGFNFNKGILKGNSPALEVGIPVYQYLTGIQMKSKVYLNFSWTLNI
jgi:hypothetical protein